MSAHAGRRQVLTEVTWEAVNDPGSYVERGSGDLYRFPKKAIIPGGRLTNHREGVPGRFRLGEVER